MDMNLDAFADKIMLVDNVLNESLRGEVPNLHDAIEYHMSTGGKRIRPLLAIMTCEALGGSVEQAVPFAAACELTHAWLLVHDDFQDGDRVRRNKPAVWVKYGAPHAVNIGDYMAHKVFQLILKCSYAGVKDAVVMKLINEAVETTLVTAEGQAMDMNLRANDSPTEEEYTKMVSAKTGRYLTMPIKGGALIAGIEYLSSRIAEFGTQLGLAFQITDDILDLTEGKGRGETGRDIKEGKRSMMVVHCIGKCTKDEREKLLQILNKPVEETTNDDVLYAKSLFEKYGSIKYAQEKAEHYSDKAKQIADSMPPKLREVLHFFADYIVKRKR
ncbi:MAG: polyprenyl synthetase family protein [Candidatus Aenigmarchaeota archaeon]|nr:polyprenyl synthetase family protein [Candidatus Aenigmarchaeota archaeon]